LTDYHRVVHLDMDSLVLGNMDELFSRDASLIYTCDYNMMNHEAKGWQKGAVCPVQGGFVVVRPDARAFATMVAIVKEGKFGAGFRAGGSGWNGTGIGHWWGGATFQGVVPFFYAKVAPGLPALGRPPGAVAAAVAGVPGPPLKGGSFVSGVAPLLGDPSGDVGGDVGGDIGGGVNDASVRNRWLAEEVDRCIYDNMVDDPVSKPRAGGENCRATPLGEVKNVHFTLCQKPWKCSYARDPADAQGLCGLLHAKWFELRAASEARIAIAPAPRAAAATAAGKYHRGGCERGKYVPMAISAPALS